MIHGDDQAPSHLLFWTSNFSGTEFLPLFLVQYLFKIANPKYATLHYALNLMRLSRGPKVAISAVVIIVVAVVSYSVFPYVASTNPKDLKPNQTAYIYGTVDARVSLGNFSAFSLNDSSGNLIVIWNGSLPAHGEKVLVHGTYREYSFLFTNLSAFEATSVTEWPF